VLAGIATPTIRAMDNRMIAAMRLVLAALALLIHAIDPSEPAHYIVAISVVLALYMVYSTTLLVLAMRHSPVIPAAIALWADVAWYVVLIGISDGANSVFFSLFFFSILLASFQWGFASGLRVTLVSTVLFTSVGFAMAPEAPYFELNRFLLRAVSLLIMGYMMACWGGSEITLRRRLALLKDVSTLSNPRFGVDRTLRMLLEQLCAFYRADTGVLILTDPATGKPSLHRAQRPKADRAARAATTSEDLADFVLRLPGSQAVLCRRAFLWWWRPGAGVDAYDVDTNKWAAYSPPLGEGCATGSYVTVPLRYRGEPLGRLYLAAARWRAFETSDVAFLLQVLEHTMPTIENIRLVDRLASDAADVERQRIARDLHDGVIQPYIGLRMGLAALQHKLARGHPAVQEDLARLIALTDLGIADLRRYMGGLKEEAASGGTLLPAVQRFARQFAEATGITVHVEAATALPVNDRLAAEVFHLVAEGLSNVRRHTQSTRATIGLTCGNGHLILCIEDEGVRNGTPVSFTPRSITERAEALGGQTSIGQTASGRTAVVVEIPL
jgi:signal transduction histidine kinase